MRFSRAILSRNDTNNKTIFVQRKIVSGETVLSTCCCCCCCYFIAVVVVVLLLLLFLLFLDLSVKVPKCLRQSVFLFLSLLLLFFVLFFCFLFLFFCLLLFLFFLDWSIDDCMNWLNILFSRLMFIFCTLLIVCLCSLLFICLSNTKLPTCLLFYTSKFIISVSLIYSLSLSYTHSDFFFFFFFLTPIPRRSGDSSAGVEHRNCDRKVAVRSPTGMAGDCLLHSQLSTLTPISVSLVLLPCYQ